MSERKVVACIVRDGKAHLFTSMDAAEAMGEANHWAYAAYVDGVLLDGKPLELPQPTEPRDDVTVADQEVS